MPGTILVVIHLSNTFQVGLATVRLDLSAAYSYNRMADNSGLDFDGCLRWCPAEHKVTITQDCDLTDQEILFDFACDAENRNAEVIL